MQTFENFENQLVVLAKNLLLPHWFIGYSSRLSTQHFVSTNFPIPRPPPSDIHANNAINKALLESVRIVSGAIFVVSAFHLPLNARTVNDGSTDYRGRNQSFKQDYGFKL